MGIASSILHQADRLVSAINPIQLFKAGELSKLASSHHQMMAAGANPLSSLRQIIPVGYAVGKNRYDKALKNIASNKRGMARGWGDYLDGYKLGSKYKDISMGQRKFNSVVRKTAVGASIAYGGGNLIFGDNPVSNTIGFGIQAASHTAITAGLSRLYKPAGIAYGGLSLYNVLKGGNNLGPF